MRAVIQRVAEARVESEGQTAGQIGAGLLVYVSVGKEDTEKDAAFMAEKLVNLRIFSDAAGKMNKSVQDVGGSILIVSNFTLHGDCKKGRRPGFDAAAEAQQAKRLYEKVISLIAEHGITAEKGVFGGHMHVGSVNDGPVTFVLES